MTLDKQLIAEGLVDHFPRVDITTNKHVGGQVYIPGVIFVDDHAVPISADTPDRLLPKLQRVASIVITTLQKYGLTTNMLPTKTAALVSFRGKRQQVVLCGYIRQRSAGDGHSHTGRHKAPSVCHTVQAFRRRGFRYRAGLA